MSAAPETPAEWWGQNPKRRVQLALDTMMMRVVFVLALAQLAAAFAPAGQSLYFLLHCAHGPS